MKEAFKWLVFLACIAALTYQVFFARSAQAGAVAPPVSEFTYTNAAEQTFHVNTWIMNGVQCSVAAPYGGHSYDKPVALSCVRL